MRLDVRGDVLRESDRPIEPVIDVGIEIRGARHHDRAGEQPENPARRPTSTRATAAAGDRAS